MAIESVVHNEDNPASTITPIPLANTRASRSLPVGEAIPPGNAWALPDGEKLVTATSFVDEKHAFSKDVASVKTAKTQFSLPRLTCGLMLRRWRRAMSRFVDFCMRNKPRSRVKPSFNRASFDLHRMARTRHLATSVARVLATKPEVVAGIRKRVLASDGPDASDDAEVAIYFGDVQGEAANIGRHDVSAEYGCCCRPYPYVTAVLGALRADVERVASDVPTEFEFRSVARARKGRLCNVCARSGDCDGRAAVGGYRYVRSMIVRFTSQVNERLTIGAVSMNVHLPRNNNGEFWIFGVVIAIILCIQVSFLGLVRYWWVHAKRGVKLE